MRRRSMSPGSKARNMVQRRSVTYCMSSGVEFGETRYNQRDLNRLWIDMVLGTGPTHGTIESIVQFNRRIAPPGTRYFYASIEPDVLGVVLHFAVNKSASDYLQEKIWQPIGAEADRLQ